MPTEPAAVETVDLRHRYGERTALDGVTLSVGAGEIFGLLGPNGGGKTTLFRVLSTLMAPHSGQARVFGRDVVSDPAGVRHLIGVVFQSPSLDKKLTAEENLWCQGRLYGLRGSDLRARIDSALASVGLTERSTEAVEQFSGGMMRRVEVAKALLHQPLLLLMDEPSTGLDPLARRNLRDTLEQLRRTGNVTVLVTTHLMEEAEHCDRLAILDRGRVVAVGTPCELKEAVGGEVLTLETDDPAALRELIQSRLALQSREVAGQVRLEVVGEQGKAAETLHRITSVAPSLVRTARVGLPTLEDAFAHVTGRSFGEADAEGDAASPAAAGRHYS